MDSIRLKTAVEERSCLLLPAETSAQALRNLYLAGKAKSRKFSLGHVCRRAGIPSTGYFSDVMKGKRILHMKHLEGIARAFLLSTDERSLLSGLVANDRAKTAPERANIADELIKLRKLLQIRQLPIGNDRDYQGNPPE